MPGELPQRLTGPEWDDLKHQRLPSRWADENVGLEVPRRQGRVLAGAETAVGARQRRARSHQPSAQGGRRHDQSEEHRLVQDEPEGVDSIASKARTTGPSGAACMAAPAAARARYVGHRMPHEGCASSSPAASSTAPDKAQVRERAMARWRGAARAALAISHTRMR